MKTKNQKTTKTNKVDVAKEKNNNESCSNSKQVICEFADNDWTQDEKNRANFLTTVRNMFIAF